MRRIMVAITILFGLAILPMNTNAADSVERLLDLLIKQGTITQEEGAVLRKEIQEDKEQKAKVPTEQVGDAKDDSKTKAWMENIEIGYKDGVFIKTKDERFLLKLNTSVQPFFEYHDLEDKSDVREFRLRRARLYVSGNAFYPWLKYSTQITLEGGSVALRDYTLSSTHFKELQPTIGQFKVPFDREFLTSGFNLQLIERSIASEEFSLQRDIGFQLSGRVFQDLLEYRVGIFNGSGANQSNQDKDLMYVGRLTFTPFGPVPYSQGSLNQTSTPRLAIGVGTAYLPALEPGERKTLAGKLGDSKILPVESDVTQVTADLAFLYRGFSLEGGYHFRNIDPKVKTKFKSVDANGFFIQAGYFIIPEHLEFAARYSFVDPDNPASSGKNNKKEVTIGPSYYLFGHRLKVQGNYTYRTTETSNKELDDHLVRLSLVFQF